MRMGQMFVISAEQEIRGRKNGRGGNGFGVRVKCGTVGKGM